MRILDEADRLLVGDGYETRRDGESTLIFEDATVLGYLIEFADAGELIRDWRGKEQAFLGTNSAALRRDPTKAWNVYSIFLTSEATSEEIKAHLSNVEEDLAATRKIARAGMQSRADVRRALAPLLATLRTIPESADTDRQLQAKLDEDERQLFGMLVGEPFEGDHVVAWLGVRQ